VVDRVANRNKSSGVVSYVRVVYGILYVYMCSSLLREPKTTNYMQRGILTVMPARSEHEANEQSVGPKARKTAEQTK
jgi:hypothetical protein